MQLKILSYNLQKHVAHCHPEMKSEKGGVGDVRQFLDDDNCNDQQLSQVYYMELVDENQIVMRPCP